MNSGLAFVVKVWEDQKSQTFERLMASARSLKSQGRQEESAKAFFDASEYHETDPTYRLIMKSQHLRYSPEYMVLKAEVIELVTSL